LGNKTYGKKKFQFEDFLAEVIPEQLAAVRKIHETMTGSGYNADNHRIYRT